MSDGTAAPDPGAAGANPAGPDPQEPIDGRQQPVHGRLERIQGAQERVHSTWDSLPWFLRWSVVWSACLLIIAAGIYLLATVASRLAPLTIALAATFFLAAMLDPLAVRLRRLRLPPALAALISLFLLLAVIGGAAYLVWTLTADQFSSLSKQLDEGLDRTRDFITGSLPVSPEQLDKWTKQATDGLRESTPDPVAGARTAAEVAGAVLLIFVLLFFLLKDGRPMWHWVLSRVSDRSRPAFVQAGRNGWHTLSAYTRGTVLIAAIDAVGIGLALVLLGVPLAFPLAVVTFLGGFIPIIGATVAGSVAVLVALAAKGPTTALLVLLAVIAVQQTEGNLLEPLIMKRQVRLHPVVILVAVTAGTLFGGIAGAFVAVPVTAVVYRVVDTVTALRQGREVPS
ncbi:AI-2E family transporter [Micromonospora sp. NBC_01699]|uniref:AI-2E family transporter n=1 Tax=Micromonospora sp. NBC_01699 TaxID=2975984 RepID=UPI002E2B7461|nr:AI-2E family transporter [Micromonospora sp. NBC_01699]